MRSLSLSGCLAAFAALPVLVGCLAETTVSPEANALTAILEDPERTLMMHVLLSRRTIPPLDDITRTEIETLADRGNAAAKNVLYVDYERRTRMTLESALEDAVASRDLAAVDALVRKSSVDDAMYAQLLIDAYKQRNEHARANFARLAINDSDLLSEVLGNLEEWKDPHAIHQIAMLIFKGESFSGLKEPNIDKAVPWALKAAESGENESLIFAAEVFRFQGELGRALEFADSAAAKGTSDGLYASGLCRYELALQNSSPEDHARALTAIRLSAEKGHHLAKRLLAALYIEGDALQQPRPQMAVPILKEMADTEDVFALRELAVFYYNGLSDMSGVIIPIDRPRALQLLQKAADGGDNWSESWLAGYRHNETSRHHEEQRFNEHLTELRRASERQEQMDRRNWIRGRISGKW